MSTAYRITNSDIVSALLSHPQFQLRERGSYLRGGPCPQCGKNELFISKEEPGVLRCSRENKCGWSETTRNLLPELYENVVEKYTPTDEEPNRTADAYLALQRGFDLSKIRGWYEQASYQLPNTNKHVATVRFYLDDEKKAYWQRIMDPPKNVKKARFHGEYKGQVWCPPCLNIEKGDRVFIVEGIFHAIALLHSGRKAVAALSAVNFPNKFIEEHAGVGVRWTIGLDGDATGRKYSKSHAAKLKAMGEKYEVACLQSSQDWDDLYRANRLTHKLVENALYHGRLFMSETVNEKAYHVYVRNRHKSFIVDYDNALYSIRVDKELDKRLIEAANKAEEEAGEQTAEDLLGDGLLEQVLKSETGRDYFRNYCNVDLISNVFPRFLYMERDEVMDEQRYVIKVSYSNGNSDDIIALEGTHITSPDAFHKALLNRSRGGTFDGDARQLKILRDRWLNSKMLTVKSIPFVGYDKDSGTYVFQTHAYHNGREIPLNDNGYFEVANQGVKTNLVAVNVDPSGEFNQDWLENYVKAFHWQGLTLLAFWLGSLFVQQIRAEHKTWPFFEFTGEPGAGKSTALEFCWKLCGRDDTEGFDIMKASIAGRRRAFNQLSNLPVVLIESDRDNGEQGAKAKQFDFDECKPFFNGRGTGTLGVAKRGNDVEEHLFQASLIISQNAEVEGSEALMQRIVHCHVDKKHHKPGSREIARWFERQSSATVGGFLREALKNEKQILACYRANFERIEDEFTQANIKTERIVKNHAQVAAMGCALQVLFPDTMTGERCVKLTNYLLGRAKAREERLSADHPYVEQFWESFHYLNSESETIKQGRLNHSHSPAEIAINLNEFMQLAVENRQSIPDLKQLKKLLPHSKQHQFIGANLQRKSAVSGKNKRCWVFQA